VMTRIRQVRAEIADGQVDVEVTEVQIRAD
jgi:hypothetical protein